MQLRLKDLKDKFVRTKVHMFFKQPLNLPRLVTDTVNNNDGTVDVRVVAQADLRTAVKECATTLQFLSYERRVPGFLFAWTYVKEKRLLGW